MISGNGASNAGASLGALDDVTGNNLWTSPIVLAGNAALGADSANASLNLTQPITDNSQIQVVTFTNFVNGNTFTLSFDNTVSLPITYSSTPATTAFNIQNALNALASITLLGGLNSPITVTPAGTAFNIKFGGNMIGLTNLPLLSGIHVTGIGTVGVAAAAPASAGFGVTKVGLGTVNEAAAVSNTYTGSTTVLEGTLSLLTPANVVAVPSTVVNIGAPGSTQFLAFSGFAVGNQYKLVFDGTPTAVIVPYQGNPVADAAAIQQALNAIVGAGNSVAVSPDYQGNFLVLFSGGLAATAITPLTEVNVTGAGVVSNLGQRTAATLQEFANNQIASTVAFTLANDGDYILNSTDAQTIMSLTMTGGQVQLAGGSTLTLAGNVAAASNAVGSASITGTGVLSEGGVARTFAVTAGGQSSDLIISAVINGTAGEGLNKTLSGRLELNNVETFYRPDHHQRRRRAGRCRPSIPNVILNGGGVSGQGTVGTIAGPAAGAAVGTVNPGINTAVPTTGVLSSSSVTWGQNSTFNADLNRTGLAAPVPGTDYDQLNVTGTVNLGGLGAAPGALLTGSSSLSVKLGDTFTIIQASGGVTGFLSRMVSGVQTPIPNGGSVFLSGQKSHADLANPASRQRSSSTSAA